MRQLRTYGWNEAATPGFGMLYDDYYDHDVSGLLED